MSSVRAAGNDHETQAQGPEIERYLATGMATQLCANCRRPMLRAQRAVRGYRRHAGRGVCFGCYGRARRGLPITTGPGGLPRRRRGGQHDVDEIAVRRACEGEPITLSTAEVTAAVALCRRRGRSIADTAELLGCTIRTVSRHRRKAAR